MTNDKADELIDVVTTIKEMVERGEIEDYDFYYNNETGVLEIKATPVTGLVYLNLNFTITPNGVEFEE